MASTSAQHSHTRFGQPAPGQLQVGFQQAPYPGQPQPVKPIMHNQVNLE
ncbi:MAG: hypothetical protein ACLROH_04055 [Streptococcus sp.]